MKYRLTFWLCILLCALGAALSRAADFAINVTITPTNAPTTNGQTLTIGGVTRTWTNNATGSPATSILTNNSLGGIVTNLANALWATRPYVGGLIINRGTNVFLMQEPNKPLVVTAGGGWAHIVTATNPITNSHFVTVPPLSTDLSIRTNTHSGLITQIDQYATNSFATNSKALENYASLGPQVQTLRNKVVTNATVQGGSVSNATLLNIPSGNFGSVRATNLTAHAGSLTNPVLVNASGSLVGVYLTNAIAHTLTVTNLNAPGAGLESQRIGANSTAASNYTTAVGYAANAGAENATALGANSIAAGEGSVAVGSGASTAFYGGTVVGSGSEANEYLASVFGPLAYSAYSNSTAIGTGATTTTNNQVRLGTSSDTVSIPGILSVEGAITNATVKGTNYVSGSLAATAHTYSSLVIGDNSNLELGTNLFVTLSGAAGAVTIHSFGVKEPGRIVFVEVTGATSVTLPNNSGTESTDATRRITTGTGGSIVMTNDPATFILRRTSNRWQLWSHSR